MKKTSFAFARVLTVLLITFFRLLLSTTVADDGAARLVPVLRTTFTNPAPAESDWFGVPVAALGSDRVLIGASHDDVGATDTGAAYLFSTNGILLTTFTNPAPAAGDEFGFSVAAVGSDRVLIGADFGGAGDTGVAYLFSTNGALLTTFTNPTPAYTDLFGYPVAAMGSDRVLIGAYQDDTGTQDAGVVHLFDTNGTLLVTFTNPAPALGKYFGISVTAIGSDRVLIGVPYNNTGAANAGVAFLFSTNGDLLTTFTNPVPTGNDFNDLFGYSAAAVGNDRVLIGAFNDFGPGKGAAYLFATNGTLLTTFTPPTASTRRFSISVAAVAGNQILIGASASNQGALTGIGAAYLFTTNGVLLTTFAHPSPAPFDGFGNPVAALGSDHVLIGAIFGDAGVTNSGAAYLFGLVPSLGITTTPANTIAVAWPLLSPGYTLQQNTNNIATANWSNVTGTIQSDGTNNYIVVEPKTGTRFYRLSKP